MRFLWRLAKKAIIYCYMVARSDHPVNMYEADRSLWKPVRMCEYEIMGEEE